MLIKTCSQCGRKGIFLKLNSDAICSDCEEQNKKSAIAAAEAFITDFASHVKAATTQSVIYPGLGREKIQCQYDECQHVLNHIDDWESMPYFMAAFEKTLVKAFPYSWYNSPIFGTDIIFLDRQGHCERDTLIELFDKLKSTTQSLKTKCLITIDKAYDYSKIFRVVGVTFSNGRQKRQTILRRLRFGDPPYGDSPDITLEQYLFNGLPAIGVYVEGDQVGNISEHDLTWLLAHWEGYTCVSEFDVTGGGPNFNYGLMIRVGFCGNEF